MIEEIKTGNGAKLLIEKKGSSDHCEIYLRMTHPRHCLLHWGISRHPCDPWQIPPKQLWPEGSKAFGCSALQTPFKEQNGEGQIQISMNQSTPRSGLAFALFFPEEDRWDNNEGRNYHISLPNQWGVAPTPAQINKDETKDRDILYEHVHHLNGEGEVAVSLIRGDSSYRILIATDLPGALTLHWGVARCGRHEWFQPPPTLRTMETTLFKKTAAQTPFRLHEGINRLSLQFKEKDAPWGIPFVILNADTDEWLKNRGGNFFIPVKALASEQKRGESPDLRGIMEEIIHAETGDHSWSLMHRFNLCYDLLDIAGNDREELTILFVWLRFSAIRQLAWQRNYNTQPRELSHALNRLTLRLADLYRKGRPENREILRSMLGTLGRGGEGQKIRDEFLAIMHRHNIKEVAGNFMEEWHQKLHNNATPDDIVICEAYLEYLKRDGDLAAFYRRLQEGGVSRERLRGFERPILADPEFYPDIKESLIEDFVQYLKILKTVHAGRDLEIAMESARPLLDECSNIHLDFINRHRNDPAVPAAILAEKINKLRSRIKKLLGRIEEPEKVRDILFLDLSLEEFLRTSIERNIHASLGRDDIVRLIYAVLVSINLSLPDRVLFVCFRQWRRLMLSTRFDRLWSLHAHAIIERLSRAIGGFTDQLFQSIQPKAELLGRAIHAEPWSIAIFSQEVVRGKTEFILSMLLYLVEPILRREANLGNWQVISPGEGDGRVAVVESLSAIRGQTFPENIVVAATHITGEEEIPEGVTAIITLDRTDILSHMAIRARNRRILFATCYDKPFFDHLASLQGSHVHLAINPAGEVTIQEGRKTGKDAKKTNDSAILPGIPVPEPAADPLLLEDFREGLVGRKSLNLKHLAGTLPAWIHIPASVALPFGTLERVLGNERNKGAAERYHELLGRIEESPAQILAEIRETVRALQPPEGFFASLRKAMAETGLRWPEKQEEAWRCITTVWASTWNDRAYFCRKAWGIPNHDLFMGVLIQEVAEPDYSFVIHTANPFTAEREELYAELVLGLGETLMGNYPGRAFGFSSQKGIPGTYIHTFPSKGTGLYGSGLIFRSDSNGEDLYSFAGAGLYDSVMLEEPRKVLLDYTREPLLWNEGFRKGTLDGITLIGIQVEQAMGEIPQDIEGAYAKGKYIVVQTRPQVGVYG